MMQKAPSAQMPLGAIINHHNRKIKMSYATKPSFCPWLVRICITPLHGDQKNVAGVSEKLFSAFYQTSKKAEPEVSPVN